LSDQAVVSLGAFLVNVVLARHLPPGEYGTFALILGVLLTLQLFTASLLYYPVSVRRSVALPPERARLMGVSVLMTALMCIPLAGVLAVVLVALGRHDLLLPALIYLLCWQMQEGTRRGLLAEFRYRSALPGDAASYLGQMAAVFLLLANGSLTLANAFYCMAATATFAALLQSRQLRITFGALSALPATLLDFWRIGSWSLANNLVSILRIQIFPWLLMGLHGPTAVAAFQAALNIVQVNNPVILGLCNVIPQTAAQAHVRGKREAWLAARPFAWLGVPPTFAYCAIALIAPAMILQIIYGAQSSYLDNVTAVRLLTIAWLISYAADMTCSYLHGVDAPNVAFAINASGAAAALLLALPLTITFGLTGSCVALVISSIVRLVASQTLMLRIFAHERPRPA
jgi:O-antigen/teichoic acid export membrane protein